MPGGRKRAQSVVSEKSSILELQNLDDEIIQNSEYQTKLLRQGQRRPSAFLTKIMRQFQISQKLDSNEPKMRNGTIVRQKFNKINKIFNQVFWKTKSLTLNFLEFIGYYIKCWKAQKVGQIQYSMKRVKERLDIVYIL